MKQIVLSVLFTIAVYTVNAQTTATGWFSKGKDLITASKFDEAIEAFEKAISMDGKYAEAYYKLGWIYNDKELYTTAIEKLKKAISLNPDHANAYQELGYAYKKKGDYYEALANINKAIIIKPGYALAYKQLGDVYVKLDRKSEAITAYENAYTYDNKNSSACYELGYLYNGKEEYEKALLWLNRALAIKPEVSTYNEVGFAYYKLKKNDEAIAAYKNALQINPKNGTAYKGIGDVYRRNFSPAKTTEAKENYLKAIENNPKSAGSHFGLGWCYNELGTYSLSIPSLKRAIELDSKLAAAYTELGYAQYMTGYNYDAINTFDKGIAISTDAKLPVYYKGLVYIVLKDKTNAYKMLDQLKPLDSKLYDKLYNKITAMQ